MSTADLRAAVEGLGASPFYGPGDDEYMCENCVTPWKCNGPHVSEKREIVGYEIDRAAVLALIDQHHCDEGVRVTPETLAEALRYGVERQLGPGSAIAFDLAIGAAVARLEHREP